MDRKDDSIKICFVSEYDALNPNVRSGVPFFIYRAIYSLFPTSTFIQVQDKRTWYERTVNKAASFFYNTLLQKKWGAYYVQWSKYMSKGYARSFQDLDPQADYYVCIYTSIAAYLPTNKKTILWLDHTQESFSTNPVVDVLCTSIQRSIVQIDERALQQAALFVPVSSWLQAFVETRNIRLKLPMQPVPRGYNILQQPNKLWVHERIENRLNAPYCKLLFVASNWKNKGGDMVITIYQELKKLIPTSLCIMGNIADAPYSQQELEAQSIQVLGYIPQEEKIKASVYQDLLTDAHFLILPSLFDGFGIVYAEAAICGLPSVAIKRTGIVASVKDGVTGLLFEEEVKAPSIAKKMAELWNNKIAYQDLSVSAHDYAEQHFNWKKNMQQIFKQVGLD